mmetsp:Transcript_33746/g.100209  ORF Transcript_33746/g.100209 Transcript_33746/m.100209 type:complete len:316 (-) Transcript_33746:317-1264(-)
MFSLLRGISGSPDPEPEEVGLKLAEHGWDKGLVVFGLKASENVVKIVTAVSMLLLQENFPYKTCRYVELSLNSKAELKTARDGSQTLGIASELWSAISSGRCIMPALAMDGKMMMESGPILEELWAQFPDESLTRAESKEVQRLLEMNTKASERLQHALKHWGWSAVNAKYAADFGYGKKDLRWEKDTVRHMDAFFLSLEEHLRKKKVDGFLNGFLVSKKLTLADCAFISWPTAFSEVLGLSVERRYPLVWKNSEMLKELRAPGSEDFYDTFPIFCMICGLMNMRNRGTACCFLCGKGFFIENPVYWPTSGAPDR